RADAGPLVGVVPLGQLVHEGRAVVQVGAPAESRAVELPVARVEDDADLIPTFGAAGDARCEERDADVEVQAPADRVDDPQALRVLRADALAFDAIVGRLLEKEAVVRVLRLDDLDDPLLYLE